MISEFRLGRWAVTPNLNRIEADGTAVHLEPKVMQVLVRLAQQPGQVVSREQLLAAVWGDAFVTDDVLKRSVFELRRALGDDAREPVYIETIPKGGYRLVAPVSPNGSPGRPNASKSSIEYLVTQIGRHPVVATVGLAGFLALVWWTIHSRPVSKAEVRGGAPVHRNLKRLTVGGGLQTDVTWSPDGRFIAYVSDRAGNFDIWVQLVAGGDPVRITKSPAHDTQPDWSPDGSSIAYRSEREGGGLFMVPALGGAERRLTSFGTHPSWSPDNREILFLDGTAPGDGEWWLRLYAVSPDGSAPRQILSDFLQRGAWYWVGRHPDGRISALGHHQQLGPGFYTVTRDGTQIVASKQLPTVALQVTAGGGKDRRRFWWHPSGTALYVQTDSNAVYNLWKVRVDVSTLAWLSAERLTTGAGRDVVAALSRDGTRMAFTTEHESSRLWVFPLDLDSRRLGPGKPLTEDGAVAEAAALSPNGRYVAYSLMRPGINRPEVWITAIVDGRSELVPTNAHAYVGCWSPEGRAIAYNQFRRDREPLAAAVAVRELGGNERLVSRWSTDFLFVPTDWTSEGALLGTYCSSMSTGPCMLAFWPTTDPHASKPERILIARAGMDVWQARFSPNRRWLSFVVYRRDSPSSLEMVVAPADGPGPERWTRVAADHTWPDKPRWAPDGRMLYFISRRPSSYFNLWGVGFDPERGRPVGQPFALTAFDSPSMFISPDLAHAEMGISSRHAVLTIKNVRGSIWMLDNVDK